VPVQRRVTARKQPQQKSGCYSVQPTAVPMVKTANVPRSKCWPHPNKPQSSPLVLDFASAPLVVPVFVFAVNYCGTREVQLSVEIPKINFQRTAFKRWVMDCYTTLSASCCTLIGDSMPLLGDLSPFDFFRQEAGNIDVEVRTEAMKKVAIVAALSGPDKTRTDMIAYLQSTF
jgi:hypothetical protein